ncbi:MAG: protein kinase [Planctomycetes bacterium]|nr:protein kinase [Planctomycetota bacterium]
MTLDDTRRAAMEVLDDDAFLDELFDDVLEHAHHGTSLDVSAWNEARPHLRSQIEDLLRAVRASVRTPVAQPARIGSYEIVRELGHGAMGTVYLARQASLGGREIALKVLPQSVTLSARARERFLLEARSLARVKHAHVVTVHDVIDEPHVLAYAMEWIDGPTFARLIDAAAPESGQPFVDGEATRERVRNALGYEFGSSTWLRLVCGVGVAVGRALGAMHAVGLVHRDVKPSNILLRRDGTALLADFGLVRDADSSMHTLSGDVVGTVGYAAPELLRGEHGELGPATDVFGLAATLYHALCFELPFGRASAVDALRRMEAGEFVAPRRRNRTLPRDLETILVKALDPDARRRYATADELADDLQRLLELQPIRARRAGPLERAWKRVRRDKGVFRAATAGAALGLSIAGFVGWRVWDQSQRAGRIAELVQRARVAFMSNGASNLAFFAIANPGDNRRADGLVGLVLHVDAAAARAALEFYDDALALGARDPDVVGEAELLRLTCALWELGDDAQTLRTARLPQHRFSPDFERELPHAAALIRNWGRAVQDDTLDLDLSADFSDAERRVVGLFAFITNNTGPCIEAWGQLDPLARKDPLLQGMLGELYRHRGQPALAYPLLLRAFEECPEAPRLGTAACSAALECGDGSNAARLLARIDPSKLTADDSSLLRLRADVAWIQGELDVAQRLYTEAFELEGNPVALQRLGRIAETRGDFERAWKCYATLTSGYERWAEPRSDLARTANLWWGALDVTQRRERIEREIEVQGFAGRWFVRGDERAKRLELPDAFRPFHAGDALYCALVTRCLRPPLKLEPAGAALPWVAPRSESAAHEAARPDELERLAALTGVFHPAGGWWCELPRGARALLARGAFAWDNALASSPVRDERSVQCLSYVLGRVARVAAHAFAGR